MKSCIVLHESFVAGNYVYENDRVFLEASAAEAYERAGIVEVVDDADVSVIENGLKVVAIIPGPVEDDEPETEIVEDDEPQADDEVAEVVDLGDDEPQAPRSRRRRS